MNLRGLAFLALRLLAIYVVFMGIQHAVNLLDFSIATYMQVTDLDFTSALLIVSVPTLLIWAVGILLWCMAGKWSGYLVPASGEAVKQAIRNTEIESFVLSVAGLIIVILSFFRLLQSVMSYVSLTRQDIYVDNQSYYYSFAVWAVELILGAVLLLKSQAFAVLLRKIRGAGLTSER